MATIIECLQDSRRYLTEFGSVEPSQLAVRIDEALAPLIRLTAENRAAVAEWLRDCARDARDCDPSVGIWANDQMADAFDALCEAVESLDERRAKPIDEQVEA